MLQSTPPCAKISFVKHPLDLLERGIIGIGVAYAVLISATLGLHYTPGPITRRGMLLTLGIVAVALLVLGYITRRRVSFSPLRGELVGGYIILIALAAFLRFTYLDYAQFQGDEGKVMLRVGAAIRGDDETLFFHKKGPAEILLPIIPYVLRGEMNEFWARAPFAFASLVTVIAVYALGRRMFNNRVGFIAGLLTAINGFLIAFARIVQYQSILLLMLTLAFFCFYRFYQEARAEVRGTAESTAHLSLGSLFLGAGLLAHYDIIFITPAIVYLVLSPLGLNWRAYRKHLLPALCAFGVFAAVTLPFYVPFVMHPHFAETYEYLSARRVGEGLLHNNLWDLTIVSTTYNSTYYAAFLALTGIAVLVWWLRQRTDAGVSLLLWYFVPFAIFTFFMTKPGTHYYVSAPAWSLAGAWVIDQIWREITARWHKGGRAALGLLGIAAYAVCTYYIYMIFVQHDPEYIRTYPQHRVRWYWTPYGDEYLCRANFGFPYQAGWKVIGHLYKTGVLQGSYYSNEKYENTQWYTQGAPYTEEGPKYYFIAARVEGARYVPLGWVHATYALIGEVRVNGAPMIEIYEREPCARSYTVYDFEDYQAYHDRYTAPRHWSQVPIPEHIPMTRLSQVTNFGHEAQLLGYRVETNSSDAVAEPSETMLVHLYWRALTPTDKVYIVFVHLEDERIWGQNDSIPLCGTRPIKSWQPGEIIADRYEVPVAPDTPAGEYPLQVGIYEWQGGERLQVFGENGAARGNSVILRSITVAE